MNKLTIIGNLTRDPELRTTPQGISVCDFAVAVNRRHQTNGQPEADFFHVTTWRGLSESCAKYLAKGRKVCVVGPVSARTYQAQSGETRVSLEITAEDVEFLTPRDAGEQTSYKPAPPPAKPQQQRMDTSGFQPVDTGEDLPF